MSSTHLRAQRASSRTHKCWKPYSIEETQYLRYARRYQVLAPLGSGKTADAVRAIVINDDSKLPGQGEGRRSYVAIKVLRKKHTHIGLDECFIQRELQHPNIVKFFRAFTYDGCLHIVLELCSNGSLQRLIEVHGHLTQDEVRRYAIQISGGIKHMHSQRFMHRDLKPKNLFLDANMNLKIGDFGLGAPIWTSRQNLGRCGTLEYMAPEVVLYQDYDERVDLWSFGVILYQMLVGSSPFCTNSEIIRDRPSEDIQERICAIDYRWPDIMPLEARSLVAGLLVGMQSRFTPDEVVAHCFVTGGIYQCKSLLRLQCQLAGVGRDGKGCLFPHIEKVKDSDPNTSKAEL